MSLRPSGRLGDFTLRWGWEREKDRPRKTGLRDEIEVIMGASVVLESFGGGGWLYVICMV